MQLQVEFGVDIAYGFDAEENRQCRTIARYPAHATVTMVSACFAPDLTQQKRLAELATFIAIKLLIKGKVQKVTWECWHKSVTCAYSNGTLHVLCTETALIKHILCPLSNCE
ncbi:predicted protein [Lichtheimia corymbifera JMRC:FSU:9682]|uniref:Uncharacterized protein n=1 Tax=Lichtheimia corymbifera JMRC:FSU:9682 TaxID=1263082 RepID=A0A068S063_9FUNG|nr:predicted protein [Lichtheimia corymbifera JMRC:FSU:9682]